MWEFSKISDGMPERDPREAEFFSYSIKTEALVREVIQNSIDAKKGSNCVKVRFAFGSVSKDNVIDYFGGLEPHIEACSSEILKEFKEAVRIKFLTIEDFGTSGLNGETERSKITRQTQSNFYSFWWCEGKSLKSGIEVGRWGLGKTTYHLASKIKSFWGLTVRYDDSRELLMGKALLKTHRLRASNDVYDYCGYYVEKNFKPIERKKNIQDFKSKFGVSRDSEPGFSVVIPMPNEDEISEQSIIKSVIIHYFFAIMSGNLEVEVVNGISLTKINKSNLISIAKTFKWENTSWEEVNVPERLMFIENSINSNPFRLKYSDHTKPNIKEDSFGDNFKQIKEEFNKGSFISFCIPVKIQRSRCSVENSHFHIHLMKSPDLSQAEEIYIRSGITIPDEPLRSMNRPFRGLFIAQDKVIASFLGDCENPSHTRWNERTDGFKDKYVDAVSTLRFIRGCMSKIVSLLDQPTQERQKDFLKDIFSIKKKSIEPGKTRSDGLEKKPDLPYKPEDFQIIKINEGFKIHRSENYIFTPVLAKLRVAYNVRNGNPFNQYSKFDFDFDDLIIELNKCEIMNKHLNEIDILIYDNDFSIEFRGFDINRDLVISFNTMERSNETQS